MAFRFRRTIKIAPGIRLNFGKSGASVSIGTRGASITVGKSGVYSNVGIPGTGMSWRTKLGDTTPEKAAESSREKSATGADDMFWRTKFGGKKNAGAAKASAELEKPVSGTKDGHFDLTPEGVLLAVGSDGKVVEATEEKMGRLATQEQKQYAQAFVKTEKERLNNLIEESITLNLRVKTPTSNKTIPAPNLEPVPQLELPVYNDRPFSIKKDLFPFPCTRLQKIIWYSMCFVIFILSVVAQKAESFIDCFLAGFTLSLIVYILTNIVYVFGRYVWNIKERIRRKKEKARLTKEFGDLYAQITARNAKRQAQWERELLDPNKKLEVVFNLLDWPHETNISYTLEKNVLWLDVDLPELEDMPQAVWEVRKSGFALEKKQKSGGQIRKDYATHIHGICLVLCSAAFWALDSLQKIYFSGYTQRPASRTGDIADVYLLSVCITRDEWKTMASQPAGSINPVEAIDALHLVRRNMTKSFIMNEISPFEHSNA